MTVSTTTSSVGPYSCNGSTTEFPVTFPFLENDDLIVYLIDSNGTSTTLTIDTHYTVTGAGGASGTVTTVATYASGNTILIDRVVDLLQETDLENQATYYPEVLEDALDKLTMIAQQLYSGVSRSIKFPTSDMPITDPVLPSRDERLGKFLQFDPITGQPVVTSQTISVADYTGMAFETVADLRLSDPDSLVEGQISIVAGYYTAGDGGGGPIRVWQTSGAPYTDNGGNIIVPTAGDGSGAWVWTWDDMVDVRWFGVDITGASSCSAQVAAIYEGGYSPSFPPGVYLVDDEIEYLATEARDKGIKFIGAGIGRTVFKNEVANGFMLKIGQSAASKFHLGSEVRGFTIETDTSPVVSGGILLQGSSFADISNIYVSGISGDAINVLNDTALDTDQNVAFSITKCELVDCGGYGINFDYTTSTANAYEIARNRIIRCAGALRLASANGSVILNGFSESSTYPQVVVDHNGLANNYGLLLQNNFFEKGREGELQIDGLIGGEVSYNTFTSNDASSGPFAVKFGYDQAVRNVLIKGNRHVVNSAIYASYSCYDIGTNATNNKIISPDYNDVGTSTKVKFATGAEDKGNIITDQTGEYLHTERMKRLRTTTALTTVAPNLSNGSWQHFFFSTAGAITINKPTNGNNDGAIMFLGINNSSGGVITVSFGSGITTQGYTDPPNGVHTHAMFCFDATTSTWRQIGAWSYSA